MIEIVLTYVERAHRRISNLLLRQLKYHIQCPSIPPPRSRTLLRRSEL